nr:hypothetical protein [Candidatus Woesearchaeota archaeon]
MKVLRNAGIASALGLMSDLIGRFVYLSESPDNFFNYALPLITLIVFSICVLAFTYAGFISLGKRFNLKSLTIISWTSLIVLPIAGYFSLSLIDISVSTTSVFLIGILNIFLGVILIMLKDKVRMSKIVGVFYIIYGLIYFIAPILEYFFSTSILTLSIGDLNELLSIVTPVATAIMFFEASNDFEISK